MDIDTIIGLANGFSLAVIFIWLYLRRDKDYKDLDRLYRNTLREKAGLPPEDIIANGDLD